MSIKKAFKYELVSTYEFISRLVFSLPRHKIFNLIKSNYMRLQGAKIGKGITYYPGIKINPCINIQIGNDVDLAWGVLITTTGGVEIGDRTLVGYGTKILSSNHIIPENKGEIFSSGHKAEKTIIGKDVWIGANCVILAGIEIGEGAVLAAGSVVTKNILPFTICGGVPAKIIKERN